MSLRQIAEETAIKIDGAREGYRSAAIRASVAYFVLDDLARVDPMYQVCMYEKFLSAPDGGRKIT